MHTQTRFPPHVYLPYIISSARGESQAKGSLGPEAVSQQSRGDLRGEAGLGFSDDPILGSLGKLRFDQLFLAAFEQTG
ncbi:MAG: hypothetical protein ACRD88_00510, partial [Terriglobia bacterium]